MDGNGRWAKKKILSRIGGHRAGVDAVDRIVTVCRNFGIEALTLYAFSDENWGRPYLEINGLMRILKEFLLKETPRMIREGIRFNTIGEVGKLPGFAQKIISETKEKTKNNKDMVLTLALSYGSRKEIIEVARTLAKRVASGELDADEIDQEKFEAELTTMDLPELDLLIRTSGEYRISNFLLYQAAYAEFYFSNTLWPDYGESDLLEAVIEFGKRERRYGLTGQQMKKKKRNQTAK